MGHLRIQEATRLKIAAQLQEGVTMQRIMDNIRDSVTFGITREHLVTKQDMHNIKNQYNIEGVVRHINDHTSVCAWVKEFQTLPVADPGLKKGGFSYYSKSAFESCAWA